MSDHDQVEQQPAAESCSAGRRLREAREQAGWTPDRLAGELGLPVQRLRALEEDDYDGFGGEVFVRGYLRRAATVLGLPADELIGAYSSAAGAAHPAEILPQLAPGRPPRAGMPGWLAPVAGVGAVALALALGWWLMRPPGAPAPAPLADEPVAVPAEEVTLPPAEPEPEAVATTPAEMPAPNILPAEEPGSGADDDAAETVAEAPAAVEPAIELPVTVELRFEFTEDCWVEVSDAREQRLAYRLYRAGDVARLRGVAPMQVFLGNAEGVRLTVDDKPVAVRPAAGRDGTARLNVGGGTG